MTPCAPSRQTAVVPRISLRWALRWLRVVRWRLGNSAVPWHASVAWWHGRTQPSGSSIPLSSGENSSMTGSRPCPRRCSRLVCLGPSWLATGVFGRTEFSLHQAGRSLTLLAEPSRGPRPPPLRILRPRSGQPVDRPGREGWGAQGRLVSSPTGGDRSVLVRGSNLSWESQGPAGWSHRWMTIPEGGTGVRGRRWRMWRRGRGKRILEAFVSYASQRALKSVAGWRE